MPTRRLPKKLTLGEVTHAEIELMDQAAEQEQPDYEALGQRGQYLWIRGLTRLQHQVTRHTCSSSASVDTTCGSAASLGYSTR